MPVAYNVNNKVNNMGGKGHRWLGLERLQHENIGNLSFYNHSNIRNTIIKPNKLLSPSHRV